MKLEDESLKSILKYGRYTVNIPDGRILHMCNLCGSEFKTFGEVMDHIATTHLEDVLPDIYPGDYVEVDDNAD